VATNTKRFLRWGGLAGLPLVAAAYRTVTARRAGARERQLLVRAVVDPAVVDDLVDLVRRVRGRANPEGRDSFSVPVPDGVGEDAAYHELRALVEKWEMRYPGVRAQVVSYQPDRTRRTAIDRVTRA
jgi:hypothetical protein